MNYQILKYECSGETALFVIVTQNSWKIKSNEYTIAYACKRKTHVLIKFERLVIQFVTLLWWNCSFFSIVHVMGYWPRYATAADTRQHTTSIFRTFVFTFLFSTEFIRLSLAHWKKSARCGFFLFTHFNRSMLQKTIKQIEIHSHEMHVNFYFSTLENVLPMIKYLWDQAFAIAFQQKIFSQNVFFVSFVCLLAIFRLDFRSDTV